MRLGRQPLVFDLLTCERIFEKTAQPLIRRLYFQPHQASSNLYAAPLYRYAWLLKQPDVCGAYHAAEQL